MLKKQNPKVIKSSTQNLQNVLSLYFLSLREFPPSFMMLLYVYAFSVSVGLAEVITRNDNE